jgi:hypothetical protein
MPSKRSRAWKQRKLVAEYAARLNGRHVEWWPPPEGGDDLKQMMLQGWAALGATPTFTNETPQRNVFDDRADAAIYNFFQQTAAKEAAARLAGTYVEPVKRMNFGKASWGAGSPFPKEPRLDGRRRKR